MPHYEFVCRTCKKTFSRMLALVDWEKERSHARTVAAAMTVEQLWSVFSLFTSQKCA
jgi:hypothetical protein